MKKRKPVTTVAWIEAVLLVSVAISHSADTANKKPAKVEGNQASAWKLEEEHTLGEQQKFVWISRGSFTMGSPESERDLVVGERSGAEREWLAQEAPRKVRLTHGYWLSDTEVTIHQYIEFLSDVGKWDQEWLNTAGGWDCPVVRSEDGTFHMREGRGPAWGDENLPMVLVSWNGALAYCRWLQRMHKDELPEGYRFNLPTEAQWEFACRAGSTAMTPAGELTIKGKNNAPELSDIAWYGGNSGTGDKYGWDSSGWEGKQEQHVRAGLHPVKQKKPNKWGLYDMIGNAREWCADWYDETGALGESTDPTGPKKGFYRITRGGSWYDYAYMCRSAARDAELPRMRNFYQGFRVAISTRG